MELMVTSVLIALLVLLTAQGYGKYKRYAEKAVCISNMKAIHQALANHLTDKGHWPQPTIDIENVTEESWFGWWIATMEPYGVSAEAWICPTDKVDPNNERIGLRGSYIPTTFDTHPSTPYRWHQPWLMERGDLHGKGAHIAMPDGRIQTTQQAN
jgi:type II secretory pathway pseudopilin PulG